MPPSCSHSTAVLLLAALLGGCPSRDHVASTTTRDAAQSPAPSAAARSRRVDGGGLFASFKVRDAAISEGRKRFRASDFAGAVEAFARAAEACPNDADAWSELGWAAFNAGDLARAQEATLKSLARTGTNTVRGATLYNLGRIDEQRDARGKAILDYEASLRARPNRVVLERLRSLDRAKAQAFALLSTTPCAGPFRSVADFCAQARSTPDGESARSPARSTPTEKKPLCAPGKTAFADLDGPKTIASPVAPYLSVILQSTFDPNWDDATLADPGAGTETLYLLVQTAAGFFASTSLMDLDNPGAFGISQRGAIKRFSLEDVVPGGPPEIVLELEHDAMDQNMAGAEWDTEDARLLMICGVGSGGRVACTLPTLFAIEVGHGFDATLSEEDKSGLGEPYNKGYVLDYALSPPGKVTFTHGKTHGTPLDPPEEVTALLGAQTIGFPVK